MAKKLVADEIFMLARPSTSGESMSIWIDKVCYNVPQQVFQACVDDKIADVTFGDPEDVTKSDGSVVKVCKVTGFTKSKIRELEIKAKETKLEADIHVSSKAMKE